MSLYVFTGSVHGERIRQGLDFVADGESGQKMGIQKGIYFLYAFYDVGIIKKNYVFVWV